jgi:hypothetical protein
MERDVLCPNRMLGLGPQLGDKAAKEISIQMGRDAVHHLLAEYETIAAVIENDIMEERARYVNPPKAQGEPPLQTPED